MTFSSLLAPATAASSELRADLGQVAPAAIVVAVVLVLLTAAAVVALVVEVRRDGYGLDRPRALSREFPWQLEAPSRRRRAGRRPYSWRVPRPTGTAHR